MYDLADAKYRWIGSIKANRQLRRDQTAAAIKRIRHFIKTNGTDKD
jgi:hypothetical protein